MKEILSRLEDAIKRVFGVEIEVELTPAPEGTGADYASNVAMKLAKVVHKSPREVADLLGSFLQRPTSLNPAAAPAQDAKSSLARCSDSPSSSSALTSPKVGSEIATSGVAFKVEVAGPGFLNFRLEDEWFDEQMGRYAKGVEVIDTEYAGKTVVVEFSDPNPFKVLHVGHLYTSVVGDSISRLLELAGAKVVRANFGGDVGLHVGKTLYCMLPQNSSPEENSEATYRIDINDIAKCYVEGTRAYDEDEEARREIVELNKIIYALAELGEEKCRERLELEMVAEDFGRSTAEIAQLSELYWAGRKLSYEYFKDFYAQIGVKFDKFYPESSVMSRGLKEVREHVGTTYEESDGAIVFKGEKVGLHTRVFINREGVPTYEAKDVGLIFTKWDDWRFDESVVITGNEQTDYMKVVLASVQEYAPELTERTRHLTHGMVKLKGGVKMSSRKGNFLKAVDVIDMIQEELCQASSDEARSRRLSSQGRAALPHLRSAQIPERHLGRESEASSSLDSYGIRNSGSSSEELDMTPKNYNESSAVVQNVDRIVLAAVKYAFLKYKMGGDIIFDPKESVAVNGNSGVYLLYSVVRAKKILQKLESSERGEQKEMDENERKFVRRLSKKIVQYGEVLAEAVWGWAPYKLCAYLYELAQEFSRFYEQVRVVGGGHEDVAEKYVRAYVGVMEQGLGVLGIEIPEEM